MNNLYRAGIAFCMGWIAADGNFIAFAMIGVCWYFIEQHQVE